jgi:hypothetical protein
MPHILIHRPPVPAAAPHAPWRRLNLTLDEELKTSATGRGGRGCLGAWLQSSEAPRLLGCEVARLQGRAFLAFRPCWRFAILAFRRNVASAHSVGSQRRVSQLGLSPPGTIVPAVARWFCCTFVGCGQPGVTRRKFEIPHLVNSRLALTRVPALASLMPPPPPLP